MTIIRMYRRTLGTIRKLVSTGKEPLPGAGMNEQAWWTLSSWVQETFGDEGGTAEEIYQKILAGKGLTADNTYDLITGARNGGYLKYASGYGPRQTSED